MVFLVGCGRSLTDHSLTGVLVIAVFYWDLPDFYRRSEFTASAFADFCAAKEIPNRADHIPQALRSGKAEIWGSC